MRLTVIIADEGSACNVGGPVDYRRVTLDLTPEQQKALALRHRWERHGLTFIEPRTYARNQPCGCVVCTCGNVDRCEGCGAKRCGTPECVFKGNGTPVFVDEAEVGHG